MRHDCPPWCHKCPDLGGDVLPVCWGSIHRNDTLNCYCERPERTIRESNKSWREISTRLDAIEKLLKTITEAKCAN